MDGILFCGEFILKYLCIGDVLFVVGKEKFVLLLWGGIEDLCKCFFYYDNVEENGDKRVVKC